MNSPAIAFALVVSVIIVLLVVVRPQMKPRGRLVKVSSAGLSVTLEDLKRDHSGFDLYYSGTRPRPSALLFVPRQEFIIWVLPSKQVHGWKPVPDEEVFTEILRRMGGLRTSTRNRLKVVFPPGDILGRTDALCLIYTSGSTSPYSQDQEVNTYVLPPVPQRGDHEFDSNK